MSLGDEFRRYVDPWGLLLGAIVLGGMLIERLLS